MSSKTITEHELEQCEHANATGRQPVVFVHGLWLLPSSWDRWATLFEDNGYVALTPGCELLKGWSLTIIERMI